MIGDRGYLGPFRHISSALHPLRGVEGRAVRRLNGNGDCVTTILVTGAAGFVARYFIAEVARTMPDVRLIGLDRDSSISEQCHQRVVCDLAEPHAFQSLQALESLDYVVHFAAQSDVHFSLSRPDIYVRDNVLATSNLIQSLARHPSVRRFLQVSSCEVYGNSVRRSRETDPLQPRTPYAASKAAQELVATSAIYHGQMPTVVCRLFNNYGRGQQGNRLIPRIMHALKADRHFDLVGDGSQTRDWIAVEDTCDALIRVLFEPKVEAGDVFNVASEEVRSVLDVLELCEAVSGRSLLTQRSLKDAGHLELSAGDASKLRAVTGWQPRSDLRTYLKDRTAEVLSTHA